EGLEYLRAKCARNPALLRSHAHNALSARDINFDGTKSRIAIYVRFATTHLPSEFSVATFGGAKLPISQTSQLLVIQPAANEADRHNRRTVAPTFASHKI